LEVLAVNAPESKMMRNYDADVTVSFGIKTSDLFELLATNRLAERLNSSTKPLSKKNIAALHRAEKVWPEAVKIAGEASEARAWLKQTNRSLGGKSPLELLEDEDGDILVLDTLARIEYGIVS
jgi:putative toxin-antitoxin system antitoxin component (TIGR02293 family)